MPDDTSLPMDEIAHAISALVSDAFLVTDTRGRIAHASGSVEALLGIPPVELEDEPIWRVISTVLDEPTFRRVLERGHESGPHVVEGVHCRADGRRFRPTTDGF